MKPFERLKRYDPHQEEIYAMLRKECTKECLNNFSVLYYGSLKRLTSEQMKEEIEYRKTVGLDYSML